VWLTRPLRNRAPGFPSAGILEPALRAARMNLDKAALAAITKARRRKGGARRAHR